MTTLAATPSPPHIPMTDEEPLWRRHAPMALAAACGLFLALGYFGEHRGVGQPVGMALAAYVASYLTGSLLSLRETWHTLKKGTLNIDFLMIAAALGAALISQWHEGATLLFLFSLSNALQIYALGRTRAAIKGLVALRPSVATVVVRGSDGAERELPTPLGDVPVGALLRLRPGERVPLDAIILEGRASVDESSLTGESIPVEHEPGGRLRSGTLNLTGVLTARVERSEADSTLSRIIRLVEQAREEKATAQQAIDRFGAVYTWCVLLGSGALYLVLRYLVEMAPHPAFYKTMVCLVVASPCALVISTPAAVLSAIGRGARLGILFKGGAHLEAAGGLKAVAVDKTGTLTLGRPQVVALLPAEGVTEVELLQQVASIEAFSQHPLAEAIVREAQARGIELLDTEHAIAVTGAGMEGQLAGRLIRVGKGEWSGSARPLPPELAAAVHRQEAEGATVVTAAWGGEWLGAVALADELRPGARAAMDALRRAGVEHLALLSGDSRPVAEHVGRLVGADIVESRLTPEDKVAAIRRLIDDYKFVGMVGDGVNDAPALAMSTVGIAMGSRGTDAALETADIVLMKDDLGRLATAVELGRATRRIIAQNLTLAVIVIVGLVATTLGVGLPLAWGVVGHEGSTLLVVLNSLRLLGFRARR